MKIVFYGEDGSAAKEYLKQLRAGPPKVDARLLHASATHHAEECDGIEFMDDVSDFERTRLTALFAAPAGENEDVITSPSGLMVVKVKKKFFIKGGETTLSGPYDTKAAAQAGLAKR